MVAPSADAFDDGEARRLLSGLQEGLEDALVDAKIEIAAAVWSAVVRSSHSVYSAARNTGYSRRDARRIAWRFIVRCTR
ncbi:hypothetical protein [Glycomyces sp. NPDC047010]|uniref:hypothetical protein n=1 Tax=Glycomyces sp. NPDC047010 TaxID=3155023 RepID=UPI0033EA891E